MALNETTPTDAIWNTEGKVINFSEGNTFYVTSGGDLWQVTKQTETVELYAYTLAAAEAGVADGLQPDQPEGGAPDYASYVYSSFISSMEVNSYTIVRTFDSSVRNLILPA
jgi:hypothetical protein